MNTAVVTGNFDGLHLGHTRLMADLKHYAEEANLKPLVLTYSPRAGNYKELLPVITTDKEKREILKKDYNLDLGIIPFNDELKKMSSEQFIDEIIIGQYKAKMWLIGYDHRFGYKGAGSYRNSKEYCASKGLTLIKGDEYFDAEGQKVGSSAAREILLRGGVERVRQLLGRDYSMEGVVVVGDQIGKKIGFPTINLKFPKDKLIPGDGVYAGIVAYNGIEYAIVLNIGYRPTISGKEHRVEGHILDFNEEIYGQIVKIKLNLRIRNEKKFDSVEDLKKQISLDIKRAKKSLEFLK